MGFTIDFLIVALLNFNLSKQGKVILGFGLNRKWRSRATRVLSCNTCDDEFRPEFDGQLYFGIPSYNNGTIQTTKSELENKIGLKLQTETKIAEIESIDIQAIRRAKLNKTPIRSRTVLLGWQSDPTAHVTVWEMDKPSQLIECWMSTDTNTADKEIIGDPFGVVMWPGSILAAREMERVGVKGRNVLVLGAGTGVEAQSAVKLGATKVIATDINAFTLKLLDYGFREAGLDEKVFETRMFDLCDENQKLPLEEIDIVVIADVLYNEKLASYVGIRCWEVLTMSNASLIVTDSQRFHGTNFVKTLNSRLEEQGIAPVEWQEVILYNITGSGIMIDDDQTYDIKARMLSVL